MAKGRVLSEVLVPLALRLQMGPLLQSFHHGLAGKTTKTLKDGPDGPNMRVNDPELGTDSSRSIRFTSYSYFLSNRTVPSALTAPT